LRALAALGVLFYHQHVGGLLAQYSGIPLFTKIDVFGANYAVPLFFLISGYCIHLSNIIYLKKNQNLPLKKYYIKRLLRIYPPYILALLFSIIVNHMTTASVNPSLTDVIIHVFVLQGFFQSSFNSINVVLWTISIELAFYLIYPIFYYLRSRYSLNLALLFSFTISSSCIIGYYLKTDLYYAAQKYFVLNLWFAWCCGAYLADKKTFSNNDLTKPLYKLIYLFIVLFFVLSLNFNYPALSIIYYQFDILIWTGPLLFLISKEHWFEINQVLFIRVITYIGLSSYSLYLLHEPLIYLKNFLVHKYIPVRFQFAFICAGFGLVPFLAWLNYIIVERPFMRLTSRQNVKLSHFINK